MVGTSNTIFTMIILDYSQVALSNVFQFPKDLQKGTADKEVAVNILRHAILTGIKYYKKKYHAQYGEVILACDGKNYWRKGIFPYYKAGRKAVRDKSTLDWNLIFDTISQIRDELVESFPYKVIHIDRAEADDVIAVMCKWTQTNGIVDFGMFEDRQKVMMLITYS